MLMEVKNMRKALAILLVLMMSLSLITTASANTADYPEGARQKVVDIAVGMNAGTYLVNDTWDTYTPAQVAGNQQGYISNRLIRTDYAWDNDTMDNYIFNPADFPNLRFHSDGFPLRATYRTPVEHIGEMKYLAQTYPEITKVHLVGYTNGIAGSGNSANTGNGNYIAVPENRIPLYALEICSAPGVWDGRPASLHQAGNHGGEIDANEYAANLMWYLCTQYGVDPEVTNLIDTTRIYILPITNGDGNTVSFRATSGNRRTNARGVDLNRNWAYRWGSNTGSSSSPGTSGNYRGVSPNSEPETTAITSIYRNDNVVSSVSGHTNGEIVIFAWAHMRNPMNAHPMLWELSLRQTDLNGYTSQNGNVMYSQSGEINDYLWGAMRALGFTYEYNQRSQTMPYLGDDSNVAGSNVGPGGQPYLVFNTVSPLGDDSWAMRAGNYINRPAADLTAKLAFLDPEDFHAGYQNLAAADNEQGTNILPYPGNRMLTTAMIETELAKYPKDENGKSAWLNGKIFMSHIASNATNGQGIVRLLHDAGAAGWIVINTGTGTGGNYSHLNPAAGTYQVEGVPLVVTSVTKGYAKNIHKMATANPDLTITFKGEGQNKDMTSVNYSWERNRPAYMENMKIAREFANQLKGTVKDADGNLIDATLNASLVIEGKIIRWGSTATDDSALAKSTDPDVTTGYADNVAIKKQWQETHKPHMDVVGGAYTWYMLPSKQSEYPDKGWDVTASANGMYTDTKNIKFPVDRQIAIDRGLDPDIYADPLYKQVIDNVNFTLSLGLTTDFDFGAVLGSNANISVPFTTYDKTGAAGDMPGVYAEVNGVEVTVKSLGGGNYVAEFNPKALGIDNITSACLTLGFADVVYSGTLIFDKVLVNLSADAVTNPAGDIGFTLGLDNANNVLTVELEFEVDNILYDLDIIGLNGFTQLASSLTWDTTSDGKYKGSVTLGYKSGSALTGFSAVGSADIAKFNYSARGTGAGLMKLTNVVVNGIDNFDSRMIELPSGIGNGAATSYVYSGYDLNKDGKISSLDLACVLLYVEFRSSEPAWNTLVKVVDNYGNPIYPCACDFIDDGVINMLDLIDLMLHYS